MNTLAAVAAPVLDGAQCVGLWSLFDPPEPDDPDRLEVIAAAKQLCSTCPALTECARWLDSLPTNQKPCGVVAGRLINTNRNRKQKP